MSDYSDEYMRGWQEGKTSGLRMMSEHCRVEAFAAIRRAAEQARCYDAAMPPSPEAFAIRYAIRAALGSENHEDDSDDE